MGVVKEQVGVAFTYPNIRLSAWFLESSGHCCSDNRESTVLHEDYMNLYQPPSVYDRYPPLTQRPPPQLTQTTFATLRGFLDPPDQGGRQHPRCQ